ncbi:lipid-binding SYLF domain-containing protein [Accumulibacter sp.]|uniref:lipid-binding SYLF domain-containing protein n=1 Tax=Accumulibacter sp. TaxID=2053492 RepID=UPI0025F9E21A|nr:lipid-binding SYLF domain-containing protein [Accumulibacter sp.]MCP5229359.1 lipid-binding SYLF domain-containing protein [Accumulibacter sp.]
MNREFLTRVSQLSRWLLIAALTALLTPVAALAADRSALETQARNAYQKLIARVPAAKALSRDAVAVLVFPKITKAGLLVGGQYGDGVLFRDGKTAAYYNTSGASYGLQAGAQQYGYAMFFMNEKALQTLNQAEGFEVGVGPSIVVLDQGMAKSLTTTTANNDIYALVFAQTGLMAGVGLQGNKITRLSE